MNPKRQYDNNLNNYGWSIVTNQKIKWNWELWLFCVDNKLSGKKLFNFVSARKGRIMSVVGHMLPRNRIWYHAAWLFGYGSILNVYRPKFAIWFNSFDNLVFRFIFLRHRSISPLFCFIIFPFHHCSGTLSFHFSAILLNHRSILPFFYFTIIPFCHRIVKPLVHFPSHKTARGK